MVSIDCCTTYGIVTAEEADIVITIVATLVPKVSAGLTSIVSKKFQFDAIPLATALVKTDIKKLDTQTTAFDSFWSPRLSPLT